MNDIAYDTRLKEIWNSLRENEKICEEQLWELCRIFEEDGLLLKSPKFVGTRSIGPFYIAYRDVQRIDILEFFASELMPALISLNAQLSFEAICSLFLCPAALLCVKVINRTFLLNNPLEWELLLYIKHQNDQNKYPRFDDIIKDNLFSACDKAKLYSAYKQLLNKASFLDNTQKLVSCDPEGRLYSNV